VEERQELLFHFAKGMDEDRRLLALECVRAFREGFSTEDPTSFPALVAAQTALRKILPASHIIPPSVDVMDTVKLAIFHQTTHIKKGRCYELPLSHRDTMCAALVATLGVCPYTGMLLEKISCDA
jgi:hypothetical protein